MMSTPAALSTPGPHHGQNGPTTAATATEVPRLALHRHLAATHNNVGAALHERGDHSEAFRHYQESIQVRMEAIKSEHRRCFSSASLLDEALEARIGALRRIEERLMMSSSPSSAVNPVRLDMFQAAESRDEVDAPFLPSPKPRRLSLSAQSIKNDDNLCSAVTLLNMAVLHAESGSLDKSSQLLDMASSVAPSWRADPTAVVEIFNAMGRVKYQQGMIQEAMESLSQALSMQREAAASIAVTGTAFELCVADTLSLMGRVHLDHGDADKSIELCREALRLRRSALGEDSLDVAVTLYNVGLGLRAIGRLDEALEHCLSFVRTASEKYRRGGCSYGAHVACALRTVGSIHLENDSVSEAVRAFTMSLELGRSVLGPDHTSVAESHFLLGRVYHDQGRYRDALRHYDESVRIERDIFGSLDHDQAATILCNAGQAHQARGDLDAALRCYKEVLRISRSLFGDNDPFVARMLGMIGNVHLERGENDDAMANFADAARIARRIEQEQERYPTQELTVVVPSLEQALGLEFHPAAAAA